MPAEILVRSTWFVQRPLPPICLDQSDVVGFESAPVCTSIPTVKMKFSCRDILFAYPASRHPSVRLSTKSKQLESPFALW